MNLTDNMLSMKTTYQGFVLYDFNLTLPTIESFYKFLNLFNDERRSVNKPEFLPVIEVDDTECALFIPGDDTPTCYLFGALNPVTDRFEVHYDLYDFTSDALAYKYIKYLCLKFEGTLVGVQVSQTGLYPVKIIQGKYTPTKIVLLDTEEIGCSG